MTHRAVVAAYGAQLGIEASDRDLLRQAISGLPVGWAHGSDSEAVDWWFRAERREGRFVTVDGAGDQATHDDINGVRQALRHELRRCVGHHTPDLTFVHAGVVAHGGKALLLPGRSHAGKSTLVEALVRAGAEFYSDEYAIFDRAGHVLQYREPLIMRGPDGRTETEIAPVGPDRPLPVGLVAITSYRAGATWAPQRASLAEGIVAVVEHAIPARDRPAETLEVLKRALTDATVLVGERGEAADAARALIAAAILD